MIELKDLVPGRATHPGEMLAIELDSAQISQQDFARQIGMQKSQLNEIIKGKRSINAESAILIATALGGPPQYWLNAQQNYDLDLARQQYKVQERSKALNTWNRFKGFVGVAYLKAQKYLSGDPMDDVPAIQKLYNIETPEQLENIVHHAPLVLFRKSQHFDENQINIITWVKMVEYFAAHQEVPPFNRYSVSEVVDSLREIILQNDNVLTKVKDTLNRQGIKFV